MSKFYWVRHKEDGWVDVAEITDNGERGKVAVVPGNECDFDAEELEIISQIRKPKQLKEKE